MTSRDQLVPDRRLPVLYFTFAHASLLLAVAVVAIDPSSLTGYFYHPLMIGVVHLVTLGWISGAILGALFIVGPLILRMPMPVGRLDYWAFAFYAIGVSGMVSHFWIEQYSGMAWSAAMVVIAVGHIAVKVVWQLSGASIPLSVRLPLGLACLNFLAAGILGVLLGADRDIDVVPGETIANVYAHAHLAGLGWATLLVVGVGRRLRSTVSPPAVTEGLRAFVPVVLVQIGVMGVSASLLVDGQAGSGWAVVAAAGIVMFLGGAPWRRRHRRQPAPAEPEPDWGMRHARQSFTYLLIASVTGLALVLMLATTWSARLAMFYGVVVLVGFLAQIVVAMEDWILPLFQRHTRVTASKFAVRPPSPDTVGAQWLPAAVFGLWTTGVPLLAAGMSLEQAAVVGISGWIMLAAVALHTINAGRTLSLRSDDGARSPVT